MGVTFFPISNGMGGTIPLMIPTGSFVPAREGPCFYISAFEAEDNVRIEVILHTPDQSRADALTADIASKTGWKTAPISQEKPVTRVEKMFSAAALVVLAWFVFNTCSWLMNMALDTMFKTNDALANMQTLLSNSTIIFGIFGVLFVIITGVFFENTKQSNPQEPVVH